MVTLVLEAACTSCCLAPSKDSLAWRVSLLLPISLTVLTYFSEASPLYL